jgi:hypothetical protein
MLDAVVQLVWSRAAARCEYCLMPQEVDDLPLQIEHIIAHKHGGGDEASNLALACAACNNHKGPNIAGLDPVTGLLTPLFHPRNERWHDHFAWKGAELIGRTPVGRATVSVLAINLGYRLTLRQALAEEGVRFEPGV